MLSGLKLSAKIYLGFAVLLAIMLALGLTAIFNLNTIRIASNHLAEQDMPVLKETSAVSGQTAAVMYSMRAYNYTGDEAFFNESAKLQEAVNAALKSWEDLEKKFGDKEGLESVITLRSLTEEYAKLRLETKVVWDAVHKIQAKMNEESAVFIRELAALLKSQNDAFAGEIGAGTSKDKLQERLDKITWVNDGIDAGNAIRIANWRGQATSDAAHIEEALKEFAKLDAVWNKLRPVTRNRENIEQMAAVKKAQDGYANVLGDYVTNFKKLGELGKQRTEVGNKLIALAGEVQDANLKQATTIGENAASSSTSSSFILLVGLILAFGSGITVAVIVNRSITGPIIRAIDELTQGSLQITSAAQQLSSASEELSQASSEQASSIEETSASLQEMAAMVENNTEHAERSAGSADDVRRTGERGNEAMRELQSSMNQIKESNEKIQDLVKVIAAIGEQTEVIDEIVFQTKLLSFNASVEAERAGEHGRGFAVVAHEVGNLAQMSSRAATQIASIVKESIQNAEQITTENKKRVEGGHAFVIETSRILADIVAKSTEMTESARQIHSASKEQSAGIGQVNQAMSQLDQVTQSNAAISEEAASSSEELSAQAVALNSLVGDLTRLIHGQDAAANMQNHAPSVHNHGAHGGTQHHPLKSAQHAKVNVHVLKPKTGTNFKNRNNATNTNHPHETKLAAGAEQYGGPSPRGGGDDDDGWNSL